MTEKYGLHKYSTPVLWKLQVYTDVRFCPNEDTTGLQLASACKSLKSSPFLYNPSTIDQTVNLEEKEHF